jgi:hypothetical protein
MPGTADADPCGFGIAEAEPTSDDIVRLAEPKGADGPVFGTGVPMPELPPGFSAPGVGAVLLVDWAKAAPPNARTSADAASVIFMMLSTVCRCEPALTLWMANGPIEVGFPARRVVAFGTRVETVRFLFDRPVGRTRGVRSGVVPRGDANA